MDKTDEIDRIDPLHGQDRPDSLFGRSGFFVYLVDLVFRNDKADEIDRIDPLDGQERPDRRERPRRVTRRPGGRPSRCPLLDYGFTRHCMREPGRPSSCPAAPDVAHRTLENHSTWRRSLGVRRRRSTFRRKSGSGFLTGSLQVSDVGDMLGAFTNRDQATGAST